MPEAKGSCLCGSVRFTVKELTNHVDACHCGMCRRWGGGPLMSVRCGNEIVFEGRENITVYDSSDWAERGFCNRCGSHLFYRLKDSQEHEIPAGLFENQDDFSFELQVFVDSKPSFYSFANETKRMTEAEVIEMFTSGQNT